MRTDNKNDYVLGNTNQTQNESSSLQYFHVHPLLMDILSFYFLLDCFCPVARSLKKEHHVH